MLQSPPYPYRKIFARGIFEAGDVVQVVVIELAMQRFEGGREVGEILHPAARRRDVAAHAHFDFEGVAVQTPALVRLGHVRQAMSRFDGENLEYFHALPICIDRRSLPFFSADATVILRRRRGYNTFHDRRP